MEAGMFRIIGAILVALGCNQSIACEDYRLPPEFQDYFAGRELPYTRPIGKIAFVGDSKEQIRYDMLVLPKDRDVGNFVDGGDPACSVSADFNGDGKEDFAGLFRYQGPEKRHNGWLLDLVILYSENGNLTHVIYPYAGQYYERQESVLVYLRKQGPGLIDLMPGQYELERPGIGVYIRGRPASTYYWDGREFAGLPMGVDD